MAAILNSEGSGAAGGAVYYAFVKREMRYYRFVEDKVSLLVDRYDHAGYPKNWYSRSDPFDMEKASPL
jgi:hypothetical protein